MVIFDMNIDSELWLRPNLLLTLSLVDLQKFLFDCIYITLKISPENKM